MKLSFGIKKKSTTKVVTTKSRGFEKVEEEKDDIEIITEVDEKGIKVGIEKDIFETLNLVFEKFRIDPMNRELNQLSKKSL